MMENEVERFLNAEQTAEKLVETLKQLQQEAQNYDTAAKDLESVRQQLLTLIDTTKEICEISYNAIKILREVNGPEIISKLGQVEGIVTQSDISLQKIEANGPEMITKLGQVEGIVKQSDLSLQKIEANGPEIISKLGQVEGIVQQNDISLQKQNEKDLIETFSRLEYLKGVVNNSGEMVTSIKEKELPQTFIVLNRLKLLITIGIAVSGVAIILGVISLVR